MVENLILLKMDINKLALLVNRVGYYTASEILQVSQALIEKAIDGKYLTPKQHAILDAAFAKLYTEDYLAETYDLDLDFLFGTGEPVNLLQDEYDKGLSGELDRVQKYIPNKYHNLFRVALAADVITPEQLEDNYTLFMNLTESQLDKVVTLLHDGATQAVADMFDSYYKDQQSKEPIFWDIEVSEFWAWFREMFYE